MLKNLIYFLFLSFATFSYAAKSDCKNDVKSENLVVIVDLSDDLDEPSSIAFKTLAGKIVDTTTALFSFRIDKDTLSRISALGTLDSDNDILAVTSKAGEVSFKGKSFEISLPGVTVENDGDISFYKSHFSFIDREDSEVFVLDSKIIFKSLETDTAIVIGRVE